MTSPRRTASRRKAFASLAFRLSLKSFAGSDGIGNPCSSKPQIRSCRNALLGVISAAVHNAGAHLRRTLGSAACGTLQRPWSSGLGGRPGMAAALVSGPWSGSGRAGGDLPAATMDWSGSAMSLTWQVHDVGKPSRRGEPGSADSHDRRAAGRLNSSAARLGLSRPAYVTSVWRRLPRRGDRGGSQRTSQGET